jgi:hypothetical protein
MHFRDRGTVASLPGLACGGYAWLDSDSEELNEQPRIYGIVYEITSPHLKHADGRLKKYIGTTTKTLETRFRLHKSKCNNTSSRVIIEAGDSTPKILECGLYADKHAMHIRERYYIELERELVVNIQIPTRSDREYQTTYISKNRESLNNKKREKILCELCNKHISRSNMATHKACDSHLSNLKALQALREAMA